MSNSIDVELATNDRMLYFDVMETDDRRMSVGDSTQIADDANLVYQGSKIRKSIDAGSFFQFTLEAGNNIATGVIASWLYHQLRNSEVSLKIGGEQVEVSEETIQAKLDEFRD